MNGTERNPDDVEALRGPLDELPREIDPPRDLWPGIAARLAPRRRRAAPVLAFASLRPALAAAALLAVFLAGWGLGRRGAAPDPAEPPGAEVAATGDSPAASPDDPVGEDAARRVLAALEDPDAGGDPETAAALRENLGVVDGAIRELEGAIERDPQNARLHRMLQREYRQRGEVLRRATEVANLRLFAFGRSS